MIENTCHHCGLPVRPARGGAGTALYCCYGCQLASAIVGKGQANPQRAWAILRLAVGAILSMNVMMVSLLLYTGGAEESMVGLFRRLMLAAATPAMVLLTWPFLAAGARALRRGQLGLDALIALGSAAAFGVSAANTIGGSGPVYFDTATMLPLLVTFGKLLEAGAKSSAASLLHALETLLPATALVVDADGQARERPLGELLAGDRLRILPGRRVPADGRVVQGRSSVEESAFTGEARPREVGTGDEVVAGTINGGGCIEMAAQRVGCDLLLRRIVELVRQARMAPSSAQRLAERLAYWFTPAVLALALAATLTHWALGSPATAGMAALSVLVVACPCTLGIATPLATAMAIARAAGAGVLVRGGDVLERAGLLRRIFFDKTGTLTHGNMSVTEVACLDGISSREQLLASLAALEGHSEHWLARAVLRQAQSENVPALPAQDVRVHTGLGISGQVTRQDRAEQVFAGSERFMRECRLAWPAGAQAVSMSDAATICIGWSGLVRGRVVLADPLRPEAAEAMRTLRAQGIEPVLLSGDGPEASAAVAGRLGLAGALSRCLPEEKIAHIRAASRGQLVGMVGDGVNDAPALAEASVGFALGGGTDLASQAGHVVLLSDRLDHIPALVNLSRRTRRIIVQNLAFSALYNAVALAAAAAGYLHPLLAAVAMTASSLTVLVNSLRVGRLELAAEE